MTSIMTSEHVRHYADAIVRYQAPRDVEQANRETMNGFFSRKLKELHSWVMSFTDDVDIAVREEIATSARHKLINEYKALRGMDVPDHESTSVRDLMIRSM